MYTHYIYWILPPVEIISKYVHFRIMLTVCSCTHQFNQPFKTSFPKRKKLNKSNNKKPETIFLALIKLRWLLLDLGPLWSIKIHLRHILIDLIPQNISWNVCPCCLSVIISSTITTSFYHLHTITRGQLFFSFSISDIIPPQIWLL